MNKKIEVTLCMGSSCFARGNTENLEFLEQYAKDNGLEAHIEIAGARCEDKCANGPKITINGVDYFEVNTEKLQEILKEIYAE